MNLSRPLLLMTAVSLSACSSYVLPVPGDFTPNATLPVTGASGFKQKQLTVGDYQVSIDRSSTDERNQGAGVVNAARNRQNYSFVVQRGGATVFSGGCVLMASETNLGVATVQITTSEKAELDCELLPKGAGNKSWRLQLSGSPDDPLNGTFNGDESYTLEGVGSAIGSIKHGPTVGYYIKRDGRTVASVQTSGKRQVLFAPDAQSDQLVAATVVLLLIDESVRELDT
jgi:hypothetical protein